MRSSPPDVLEKPETMGDLHANRYYPPAAAPTRASAFFPASAASLSRFRLVVSPSLLRARRPVRPLSLAFLPATIDHFCSAQTATAPSLARASSVPR